MKMMISLLILSVLVGCATTTKTTTAPTERVKAEEQFQRELAAMATLELETRLSKVSLGVLYAAAPSCKEATDYGRGLFFGAGLSVGVSGEDQVITDVIRNSPADRAGLRAGDIIVAVSADPASMEPPATFSVKYKRGKKETKAVLAPLPKCSYTMILGAGNEVNAYADGKRIIISRGMMMFARDDTELSFVIAHELAHNVMSHIDAKTTNYIAGSVLDVIVSAGTGIGTQGTFGRIGAQAFSQDFEREADYVGLYILANAGADIEKSPAFWRRMAALNPGGISSNHAATHPATPERFVAMEETIREIRAKQKAGKPLVPEMK